LFIPLIGRTEALDVLHARIAVLLTRSNELSLVEAFWIRMENIYNNKNPHSDCPSFFFWFRFSSYTQGFRTNLHFHPPLPPTRPIYNNVYEIFYCASKLIYTIFSWRLRMWIRYPPFFCFLPTPPLYFLSLFLPYGNPPRCTKVQNIDAIAGPLEYSIGIEA